MKKFIVIIMMIAVLVPSLFSHTEKIEYVDEFNDPTGEFYYRNVSTSATFTDNYYTFDAPSKAIIFFTDSLCFRFFDGYGNVEYFNADTSMNLTVKGMDTNTKSSFVLNKSSYSSDWYFYNSQDSYLFAEIIKNNSSIKISAEINTYRVTKVIATFDGLDEARNSEWYEYAINKPVREQNKKDNEAQFQGFKENVNAYSVQVREDSVWVMFYSTAKNNLMTRVEKYIPEGWKIASEDEVLNLSLSLFTLENGGTEEGILNNYYVLYNNELIPSRSYKDQGSVVISFVKDI